MEEGYLDIIVKMKKIENNKVMESMRGFQVDVEYWKKKEKKIVKGRSEKIMEEYRDVRERMKRRIKLSLGLG